MPKADCFSWLGPLLLGGSQPSPQFFYTFRVQLGFPFNPLKVTLLAGDLKTDSPLFVEVLKRFAFSV